MIPVSFKEQNVVWAQDQPQYLPLPAYTDETITVTCWKLTWRELFKFLFTRKLWLMQLNFSTPLQPQKPTIDKPIEVL